MIDPQAVLLRERFELSARLGEFEPTGLPGETALMIEVSGAFFAALNLQAARERDNRARADGGRPPGCGNRRALPVDRFGQA